LTKKLKPKPKVYDSRSDTAKWQRDRRIARFLTITIPLVILVVVVLIAFWGYNNYVASWNQSVTQIGNTTIDMDHYVKMLRYYDKTQTFEIDNEPSSFDVLNTIKERELVQQAAEREGIQVSEANITNTIENVITAELQNQGNVTQEEREEYYQRRLEWLKLSEKEYRTIIEKDLYYSKFRDHIKEQQVPEEAKHVDLYIVEFNTADQANETLGRFLGGNSTLVNAGNVTVTTDNETEIFDVQHIGWIPEGLYPEYDVAFTLYVGNVTTVESTLIEIADIDETMTMSSSHRATLAAEAYDAWHTQEEGRLNSLGQYKDFVNTEDIVWAVDKAKQ